jgi:hypothetical protein
MCFGGSSPAPAPAVIPPPQAAISPAAPAVRQNTAAQIQQQAGTTLLTGGQGQALPGNDFGKKTLLGQ